MRELKDASDLFDADAQAQWALRRVAGGLDVSATDVARLESAFISGRASRPARQLTRRLNWPFAACAVLALALAVAALSMVGGERAVPAALLDSATRPLTAADLVGVWRVEADPRPIVWVLNTNGTMAIWSAPEDLTRDQRDQGFAYRLEGDVLTVRWHDTCTASWAVSVLAPGRLPARHEVVEVLEPVGRAVVAQLLLHERADVRVGGDDHVTVRVDATGRVCHGGGSSRARCQAGQASDRQ